MFNSVLILILKSENENSVKQARVLESRGGGGTLSTKISGKAFEARHPEAFVTNHQRIHLKCDMSIQAY